MDVLIVAPPNQAAPPGDCFAHTVTFATTAAEALDILRTRDAHATPFDALLCDLALSRTALPADATPEAPDPLLLAAIWSGIPRIALIDRDGTNEMEFSFEQTTIDPTTAWIEMMRPFAPPDRPLPRLTEGPQILAILPAFRNADGTCFWDESLDFLLRCSPTATPSTC